MRLELVGGAQARGDAAPGGQGRSPGGPDSPSENRIFARLDDVERDLAGVRARLQILLERAAELRRCLAAEPAMPSGNAGAAVKAADSGG